MTLPALPPIAPSPAAEPTPALAAPSIPITIEVEPGMSTNQMLLTGAGFVVVLAICFFVQRLYANYLVRERKLAPRSANLSGMLLFGSLICVAVLAFIGTMAGAFFRLPFILPLAGAALAMGVGSLLPLFKR